MAENEYVLQDTDTNPHLETPQSPTSTFNPLDTVTPIFDQDTERPENMKPDGEREKETEKMNRSGGEKSTEMKKEEEETERPEPAAATGEEKGGGREKVGEEKGKEKVEKGMEREMGEQEEEGGEEEEEEGEGGDEGVTEVVVERFVFQQRVVTMGAAEVEEGEEEEEEEEELGEEAGVEEEGGVMRPTREQERLHMFTPARAPETVSSLRRFVTYRVPSMAYLFSVLTDNTLRLFLLVVALLLLPFNVAFLVSGGSIQALGYTIQLAKSLLFDLPSIVLEKGGIFFFAYVHVSRIFSAWTNEFERNPIPSSFAFLFLLHAIFYPHDSHASVAEVWRSLKHATREVWRAGKKAVWHVWGEMTFTRVMQGALVVGLVRGLAQTMEVGVKTVAGAC